jgi:hypothetical protein
MTEKETHPAIISNATEVSRVLDVVRGLYPYLLLSHKNIDAIWGWLWRHEAVGGFNEHNVGVAVRVLDYAGELERAQPVAPPKPVVPPAAPEPEEHLEPGEISIRAEEFELQQSTPAQIRSYLRRLRAANG